VHQRCALQNDRLQPRLQAESNSCEIRIAGLRLFPRGRFCSEAATQLSGSIIRRPEVVEVSTPAQHPKTIPSASFT
jgi:hypothetical protein